jgi:hypothetical protein
MLFDPKWNEPHVVLVEPWRQNLLLAAQIVRQRGLAKWEQQDRAGRVCVQGAISLALTGKLYSDMEGCAETRALHRYLLSQGVPEGITSPGGSARWNNQHERTAGDVIEALEGAAALAPR